MEFIFQQTNLTGRFFVEFALLVLLLSGGLISALLLIELLLRGRLRAVFRYLLWMSVPLTLTFFSILGVVFFIFYLIWSGPLMNSDYFNSEALDWEGAIFLIWIVAVCGMILFLLHRTFAVSSFISKSKQANSLMKGILWYCRTCIGIKNNVELKITKSSTQPVVCGIFRPVILIPQNLTARLGSRHLRSVLLHELAHIKHRHLVCNLLQKLLLILYFYNPLLWVAEAMIRRIRDQAVDEMVVSKMGEKARWYPENLVNVSNLRLSRPGLSLRMVGVAEFRRRFQLEVKNIETDATLTSKAGIPA